MSQAPPRPPSPTATPAAPPGWYPDPAWAGAQRWWDGTTWTTHARWVPVIPPPPPPPLAVLRHPAFWIALAGTVGIVVGGRVLQEWLVAFVTTLTAFMFLQWGFYIVVYGGMAALVVAVVRRHGTGSFRRDLGWSFRWSDLGWGFVLFISTRIAQIAVTAPLLTLPVLRRSTQEYSDVMTSQPIEVMITLVIVGVVVAPIVEELLFRGVLLRSLLARVGAPVAAVVQGIIFGCYHYAPDLGWYNLVLITANSVFGIIFGFVALRRRSLGTGVVAHAITNGSAFVFMFALR